MYTEIYEAWYVSPRNAEQKIIVRNGRIPLYNRLPGSSERVFVSCHSSMPYCEISRVKVRRAGNVSDARLLSRPPSAERVLILSRSTVSKKNMRKMLSGSSRGLEKRVVSLIYPDEEHVIRVFGFGFETQGNGSIQIRLLTLVRNCTRLTLKEVLASGRMITVDCEIQYDSGRGKFFIFFP